MWKPAVNSQFSIELDCQVCFGIGSEMLFNVFSPGSSNLQARCSRSRNTHPYSSWMPCRCKCQILCLEVELKPACDIINCCFWTLRMKNNSCCFPMSRFLCGNTGLQEMDHWRSSGTQTGNKTSSKLRTSLLGLKVPLTTMDRH